MRPRQILHVDMDAFYASIEQRDDPALRGRPVLVGGRSPRSVVATASYEARVFGARSAMPMARAIRLCPEAVVVPPRMARYAEVSGVVMGVLARYSPLVEPLSLDEAFVDATASRALFGDGRAIAEKIRADIHAELGLTASAGVATSKFVAKVASDAKKPDGLTVVDPGDEARFLAAFSVERMWGIGPKAAERVRAAGYRTIADLARARPEALERVLGSWGRTVGELARGEDVRDVHPDRAAVSVSAEETFDLDLFEREDLERALLVQASRVAHRLAAAGLAGRTIMLKIKLADFKILTRHRTLDAAVFDTVTLHRAACELLDKIDTGGRGIRLCGVGVKELVEHGKAPRELFPDEAREKRSKLESALVDVRAKFGAGAVVPAAALKKAST